MKLPILYLAGPMSGLPDYNFPEFERVATELRFAGYLVLTPHELKADNGEEEPEDHEEKWRFWMRKCVMLLACAEAVATLPGWKDSRGATLECYIGEQLGFPCKDYQDWLAEAPYA